MSTAESKPTNLGAEKPKGPWGTILTMTPVVLTIIATAFAGMSSSEMTQSMYFRSLAAQNQSKAGDQWSFFQAKRIRGTSLENTVDILQGLAHPEPFDPARMAAIVAEMKESLAKSGNSDASAKVGKVHEKIDKLLKDEKAKPAWTPLTGGPLPSINAQSVDKPGVKEILDAVTKAINEHKTEGETATQVHLLHDADIQEAILIAEHNADAFDAASKPIGNTLKSVREILRELATIVKPFRVPTAKKADDDNSVAKLPAQFDAMLTSFKTAAMDVDARRYREEANYNQKTAELYEIQVRFSGVESDRHRTRSRHFFYSMLTAQAGVTIASLALAKAQRSALWFFAAIAGLAALTFSGYVYFMF